MVITKQGIKEKIDAFLTNSIQKEELAAWAWNSLASDKVQYSKNDERVISEVISLLDRLGDEGLTVSQLKIISDALTETDPSLSLNMIAIATRLQDLLERIIKYREGKIEQRSFSKSLRALNVVSPDALQWVLSMSTNGLDELIKQLERGEITSKLLKN